MEGAAAPPLVLTWARALLSVAFVAALPLLLISTSLRLVVEDRGFILDGFRTNNVAATTGIGQQDLLRVADAFVDYFRGPPGRLDVTVQRGGQQVALFNERELVHMEDVQALVQVFLRMQLVLAAILLARVALAVVLEQSPRLLGRDLVISAAFMLTVVALIGVLAAIDFTGLWTRFHQVAFRNDLWMLDPRTDYLIMLFPEPFWLAATTRMAALVGGGTLLAGVVGWALWHLGPEPRV